MDDITIKATYYAVIPARVRYDENLTYFDMILYGEISALTLKVGYCFAKNDHFENLYKKNQTTITASISRLVKNGHLYSIIDKENGNARRIYLNYLDYQEALNDGGGIGKNTYRGIGKNTYSHPIKNTNIENEVIKSARKSSMHSKNLEIERLEDYELIMKANKEKELSQIIDKVYTKRK